MSITSNDLLRFDDFELQPSRRVLLRGGEKISIAPKTFEVLLCLVRDAGRVVLKEQIFNSVWPGSFIEEGNLTQHIFWLRKALGDKAGYIVTIPGRGYEFTGVVEAVSETVATAAQPAADAPTFSLERTVERTHIVVQETQSPVRTRRTSPWLIVAGPALLVLCASASAAWIWLHRTVPGDHHQVVVADFENSNRRRRPGQAAEDTVDNRPEPVADAAGDGRE